MIENGVNGILRRWRTLLSVAAGLLAVLIVTLLPEHWVHRISFFGMIAVLVILWVIGGVAVSFRKRDGQNREKEK